MVSNPPNHSTLNLPLSAWRGGRGVRYILNKEAGERGKKSTCAGKSIIFAKISINEPYQQ
jgi:hypothetical protein